LPGPASERWENGKPDQSLMADRDRSAIDYRPAKAPEGWRTPGHFAPSNGHLEAVRGFARSVRKDPDRKSFVARPAMKQPLSGRI
jgi:hypothetical protein